MPLLLPGYSVMWRSIPSKEKRRRTLAPKKVRMHKHSRNDEVSSFTLFTMRVKGGDINAHRCPVLDVTIPSCFG